MKDKENMYFIFKFCLISELTRQIALMRGWRIFIYGIQFKDFLSGAMQRDTCSFRYNVNLWSANKGTRKFNMIPLLQNRVLWVHIRGEVFEAMFCRCKIFEPDFRLLHYERFVAWESMWGRFLEYLFKSKIILERDHPSGREREKKKKRTHAND